MTDLPDDEARARARQLVKIFEDTCFEAEAEGKEPAANIALFMLTAVMRVLVATTSPLLAYGYITAAADHVAENFLLTPDSEPLP